MNIGLKDAHSMAVRALPASYHVKVTAEVGKGYSWESEELRWTISATDESNAQEAESDTVFTIALARLAAELSRARATQVEEVVVEETTPEPEPEPSESTTTF